MLFTSRSRWAKRCVLSIAFVEMLALTFWLVGVVSPGGISFRIGQVREQSSSIVGPVADRFIFETGTLGIRVCYGEMGERDHVRGLVSTGTIQILVAELEMSLSHTFGGPIGTLSWGHGFDLVINHLTILSILAALLIYLVLRRARRRSSGFPVVRCGG